MTTKPCKCRYDAAGHRVLPHADMQLYYKDDPRSLKLVRSSMPHKYVCVPHVEIHIHTADPISITVYRIYPGETITAEYIPSKHALEGLRATFRGGKVGWTVDCKTGLVVLRRAGMVIPDPLKRYGLWA